MTFEVDARTTLRIWHRRERERRPLEPAERAQIARIAARQLELSRFRY